MNVLHLHAMSIGDRIRAARRRLNMTQKQLAEAIGAEQSTVSGWESDPARHPARSYIAPIAKTLGVTRHYLEFGGATDRGREWEDDFNDAAAAETAGGLDVAMLSDCLKLAMRSLIAPHGLSIQDARYDQAAEAAVDAYLSYLRLSRADTA